MEILKSEYSPPGLVDLLQGHLPNCGLTENTPDNPLCDSPGMEAALSRLPKILLDEMSEVKLMNRTDIKYVVHASVIPELIKKAGCDYFIQEIDGRRVADYGTVYLDTRELLFFRTHMNGKLNRYKWRIRSYLEYNLSFLEIKNKTNKGVTQKKRIAYNPSDGLYEGKAAGFIQEVSGCDAVSLLPVLQNRFKRITLVNNKKTERVTIDFDISFRNCLSGATAAVRDAGIIEIKYDHSCVSAIRNHISEMRIRNTSISKYCLGIVLTTKNCKANSYKQKLRYIHKITGLK
jgi:hypothetical protein